MRARNHLGIGDVAQRASVRVRNAHGGQLFADRFRACRAAVARASEAFHQRRTLGIDIQADDMHGSRCPRHRNFDAAQITHAKLLRGGARFGLPADLVVIRQRPQRDAAGVRAARDVGGRELAVGDRGMAVQIGVHRCLEKFSNHFTAMR